ncbi:hypothetical protein C2E23DRAFT_886334 [Lenzites betulinus]|nr:hypothetical protein C2E23DRAFT_886334 [Lenzites betulinus]
MTIEPKEYFLFLRSAPQETAQHAIARREQGFPDESDSHVYTNRNRIGILNTVNSVFQTGVTEVFPLLPSLVAPLSQGIYTYDISRSTLDTRALLIWRKLTPNLRRRHAAQYQVYFYVPSRPPMAAVNLAYFMLFFTYTAIRTYVTMHYDYDVHRQPQLKGLAYHLRSSGSTGVAFFDYIDDVYNHAAEPSLAPDESDSMERPLKGL